MKAKQTRNDRAKALWPWLYRFVCRKYIFHHKEGSYLRVMEHRNTIDATAFAHSQASSIMLFFTPWETALRYESPELRCGDPASGSPSG